MTKEIDGFGSLIGALRKRVRAPSAGERRAGAGAATGARGSAGPDGVEALRGRIRDRLRALPEDDAQRPGRAAQLFVESVLIWEFGDALAQDPEFSGLVTRVREELTADDRLSGRLHTLLAELSRG